MRDFTSPGSDECNTGQFVIALDVSRFLPSELFAAELDRHLRDLKSSAPQQATAKMNPPFSTYSRRTCTSRSVMRFKGDSWPVM